MEKLQIINISGSRVKSLPTTLHLVPNLTVLDFSGAPICAIPWLGYWNLAAVHGNPCVRTADWSGVGLDHVAYPWI